MTQQLLQDTSRKYRWDDWGEEPLLKAMDAKAAEEKAQDSVCDLFTSFY